MAPVTKEKPGPAEKTAEAEGTDPIKSPTNSEENLQVNEGHADGEDEEERESFGSKIQYLLTLVGYAVGFGNIWRFPYLVQENGGIVFLIPYTISLFLIGIPTFFLEIAIGQRLRKGPVGCWNEISPYLGGIGIATGTICFIVALYYNTLLAWAISYFADSFRSTLLYETCSTAVGGVDNPKACDSSNTSNDCHLCENAGSSQYYWYNSVLMASPGISQPGEFNWWIMIWLAVAWLLIWGICFKGVKIAGKVVYFTALFPYAVLLIFLINGLTLTGMGNGYSHLFTPQWDKLGDGRIWKTAAAQIFFSLGLGFGCLVAFASYLKPNNNCYQDAITISYINCGTSLFAAFTMFPYLGSLGTSRFWECKRDRIVQFVDLAQLRPLIETKFNVETLMSFKDFTENDTILSIKYAYNVLGISDVGNINFYTLNPGAVGYNPRLNTSQIPDCDLKESIKAGASGTGFVFIVMAKAISTLPCPPIWAFLFFAMLITLGVDSAFGTVEGAIAAVMDLKIPKVKRWMATSVICGILWMLSFMFVMGWASYIQVFLDDFCANWSLLLVALFESIGIAWVYGLHKFAKDVTLMTGVKPSFYFLVCWKYVTPIAILVMLLYSIVENFSAPMAYSKWNKEKAQVEQEEYPPYAIGIGFTITVFTMIGIPIVALLHWLGYGVLHPEIPAEFPEEELKLERHYDEITAETNSLAKYMYWGSGGPSGNTKGKMTAENASLNAGSPGTSLKTTPNEEKKSA